MRHDSRRDSRYDILFEPVVIGPVTARNRIYQVPPLQRHGLPRPDRAGVDARGEGGGRPGRWCAPSKSSLHHTSDINPFVELRLWDDRDIPMLARMADRIHEFGSLAGIELAYNGMNAPNFYGREVPMGPSALPVMTFTCDPVQARAMTKRDIRDLRRWHRAAALRGRRAGFDLIYVYAGHSLTFLHHFLSRRYNRRTDEYGGSLENRVRLLKEVLIDTREAVGDTCAVPCRISMDELLGPDGLEKAEAEDAIGLLAELPDLWDLVLAGWENDSVTSRFGPEGGHEPFIEGVRKLTTKPVVAVGPVHVSRPDGVGRQEGPGRPHRLRAAFDRRSVPPEEDRGRASRGHPRVHRLQHLRLRRLHGVADPVHPESDDGRGVAQGLAPRTHPSKGVREAGARRRRGPRGPRSGARAGQARLRRDPRGEGHRARRARGPGVPSARAVRLGAGPGLPRAPASPARQRQRLLRLAARCGVRSGVRIPAGRDRHRRTLANRRNRSSVDAADADRGRRPGALARRRDGRARAARGEAGGGLGRRPLLHGRRDGGGARGEGVRGDLRDAGRRSLHLDPQHDGAALHSGTPARDGGVDSHRHQPGSDFAGRGHGIVHLHRTHRGDRDGRGHAGDVANPRGPPCPGARGPRRGLAGGRHRVGDRNRRRARAGHPSPTRSTRDAATPRSSTDRRSPAMQCRSGARSPSCFPWAEVVPSARIPTFAEPAEAVVLPNTAGHGGHPVRYRERPVHAGPLGSPSEVAPDAAAQGVGLDVAPQHLVPVRQGPVDGGQIHRR